MIKKYKEIKKNKSQLMWFILKYASIAQLVECSLGKAEVTGSIPVGSSNDVSVRTNRKEQIIIANYLLFRYNLQYKEIRR